jgi:signal peptidase I
MHGRSQPSTRRGRPVMAAEGPADPPRPGDTIRGPLAFGRETLESIVVAFTLALLFRSFEAEAFVIPTGSMAPTLMGRHKDLACEACGFEVQVGASREEDDQSQSWRMELGRLERAAEGLERAADDDSRPLDVRRQAREKLDELRAPGGPLDRLRTRLEKKMVPVARCPNCGFETRLLEQDGDELVYDPRFPSFSGDRILVSKMAYDFAEPERFDVIVFKYPEDAKINYIKRLVGLPGETISIIDGDLWVSREGDPERIVRKPPEKLLAMLQVVHDSRHQPRQLRESGWPSRWTDWAGPATWRVLGNGSFEVDCRPGETATLRYRHLVADEAVWRRVADGGRIEQAPEPRLIDDFQPYNAIRTRSHWVGDLAVECELEVSAISDKAAAAVQLDLVEGGLRYACRIDLASGEATLSIPRQPGDPNPDEGPPRGRTGVRGSGRWRLLLANVDDQISLFVDGSPVAFDRSRDFQRQEDPVEPETSPREPGDESPGDLAPAGVTVAGAEATIHRLRMLRDIFYIGAYDLGRRPGELLEDSRIDYDLGPGEFLVLGDNSAASKDSRLWAEGHHVDRHLLVGRALLIFWPHPWPASWGVTVPMGGWELRLPFWPNFARMRPIR